MGDPTALIIVPWRDKGDPWRAANIGAVLDHLDRIDVAPVAVCDDNRDGVAPFNRSAAYNHGVRDNPDAAVYVFHEADMLIDASQLRRAIDDAARSPGLIVPFTTYRYLTPEDTEKVRAGANPATCVPEYVMADCRSNGAVNVVSAVTLSAAGRYDETFEGWGFDDRAMARAFDVATGNPTRYTPGYGTHLWHTPGWSVQSRFHGGANIPDREHAATVDNEKRYRLYRKAHTAQRIRELTAGGQ